MRITQAHLDRMACPVCHGPLHLLAAEDSIDCTACTRRFPIVDDLPVLIASRATVREP